MQIKALIQGVVQGVGFRPFVYRIAKKYKLKGYVKNTSKGVEIILDGSKKNIKAFFDNLEKKAPPLVKIEKILIKEGNFGEYNNFEIIKSAKESKAIISIPPDIGICEDCLKELRDKKNRRYRYWFITCTNCGPRFTIIEKLPYDRITTTMKKFKMCEDCEREYKEVGDRRYHAQTIACPRCGPKLSLLDNNGRKINTNNIIKKTAELLKQGKIVAIKGIGGIHLACLSSDSKVVKELRRRKRRLEKPFAIMAKDIAMIKTFAKVNKEEKKILESWRRPIVLLEKSKQYWLAEELAPGLSYIGVMLPYTPLHYLLFDQIDEPLVMTSANFSNEPTIKNELIALAKLKKIADYFLIHNREIYQRCDDSVIKVVDNKTLFLRRSRGYVPQPIKIDLNFEGNILALGAELENTFCIYKEGKAYLSQYIGNTSNYDTFYDLKRNIKKFQSLLGIKKFDLIICDLHPIFNTTKLAEELGEKNGVEVIKVQHHFAHLASCMAEHNLNEAIGIVCDGYGYGLDKKAWGGEIILAKRGKFRRVGHLEYFPLIGGDLATKYPVRIAFAILSKFMNKNKIKELFRSKLSNNEVEIWLRQINEHYNIVESSSCGRVLDAVASLLGVCERRTYEGEPAMKLESLALKGKKLLEFPVEIKRRQGEYILTLQPLFENLVQNLGNNYEDLALSTHYFLASGLAKIAKKFDITNICFTGGVAYNHLFNKFLREKLPNLFVQTKVPCGDGGISLGQVYINKFLDAIHQ